jgi:hypothetical protein
MRRHFITAFDHLCPALESPFDDLQCFRIKQVVVTEPIASKPTLIDAVAAKLWSQLVYFGKSSLELYLDQWLRVVGYTTGAAEADSFSINHVQVALKLNEYNRIPPQGNLLGKVDIL